MIGYVTRKMSVKFLTAQNRKYTRRAQQFYTPNASLFTGPHQRRHPVKKLRHHKLFYILNLSLIDVHLMFAIRVFN